MTYDQSRYFFVDTETTGLDPAVHAVWEVAIIVDGHEYVWQLSNDYRRHHVDAWAVDLTSLRINRMLERYDDTEAIDPDMLASAVIDEYAQTLHAVLEGRHLVAANPKFDMDFLTPLFTAFEPDPPWHYRPICVESLAMGFTGEYVKGLKGSAEAVGVPYDESEAHGALYDARLAKQIFEAVMGGPE